MRGFGLWMGVFWGIAGLFFGLFILLFFTFEPMQEINEQISCEPGERLASETQVTRGTESGSETRLCCASPDDTREFGKCDWSNSMSFEESKPILAPFGLSFGASLPVALILTLVVWWMIRRRRTGQSRSVQVKSR